MESPQSRGQNGRGKRQGSGDGPDVSHAPSATHAPSAAPRRVPDAGAFVFSARHEAQGTDLPWGTDDLILVFDERGVVVGHAPYGERQGRQWASVVFPWASITRVARGATEVVPGGRNSVTTIDIEASGRCMRFSIWSPGRESVRLAALSERVRHWVASDAPGLDAPGAASAPLPRPVPALFLPGPTNPPDGDRTTGPAPIPGPTLTPTPGPGRPPGPSPRPGGPRRPAVRHRRIALVTALVLFAAGAGSALVYARSATNGSRGSPAASRAAVRAPGSEQALADRLVLGTHDLPAGWTATSDRGGPGTSPKLQSDESAITASFGACMGIDEARATMVLDGGAVGQIAQKTSPVFVGPPAAGQSGNALELQTAVAVVRTHQDVQQEFALLRDPLYPRCIGAAVASEAQLGADATARTSEPPGGFAVIPVDEPAIGGEQASGLLVTFMVSERSASVPVEVVAISLGYDRVEAGIQALSIGGQIPSGTISAELSNLEQRVAAGGTGSQT